MVVSAHFKNISQNVNLPQIGVNIKTYLKPPPPSLPVSMTTKKPSIFATILKKATKTSSSFWTASHYFFPTKPGNWIQFVRWGQVFLMQKQKRGMAQQLRALKFHPLMNQPFDK